MRGSRYSSTGDRLKCEEMSDEQRKCRLTEHDIIMKLSILIYISLVSVDVLCAEVRPIVCYDFNAGSGTIATSSGSCQGDLSMTLPSKESAELYSTDAKGITGKSGDFALDIGKTASGMGAASAQAGMARVTGFLVSQAFGALSSFTITGWYRTDELIDGGARLVELSDPEKRGFCLMQGGGGLVLTVNGKIASSPYRTESFYKTIGDWVFFAVTYDGTKMTNNVTFYSGTRENPLKIVGTASCDAGAMQPLHAKHGVLSIGNEAYGYRPFRGLLDDVAIYGEDATGNSALKEAQIREIYQANLDGIANLSGSQSRSPSKSVTDSFEIIDFGLGNLVHIASFVAVQ